MHMTPNTQARPALPLGRLIRLLMGVALLAVVGQYLPSMAAHHWRVFLTALIAITVFYFAMHFTIQYYFPNINRWFGAVLANVPAGFLIFANLGAISLAALAYVGISLLLDAVRADAGCEVMALPGLVTKKRTHLVCLALSPIDAAEGWITKRFRNT